MFLHLVRQFVWNIEIVFNHTEVEYPDTIEFYKRMTREWKRNVIRAKPDKSFWWVIDNLILAEFENKTQDFKRIDHEERQ